jgi:dolichol-phosphate mannosyltransferase
VVLPTYNERDNLPSIAPVILQQSPEIDVLVVDDDSPDGTGAIADELASKNDRIHVIHRKGKLGLGTAYVEGFQWALANGYAYIFEMDADFSHDPAHLKEFLGLIRHADVVLGSRYLNGVTVVNWPMPRLLLSFLSNKYARLMTGVAASDLTSGFRCYRREVLEAIHLDQVRSSGYAFQIEMVFRAARKRFRIAEMPIIFVERRQGESKMSKRIILEALWLVWRFRLLKIFGRI